jgi:hypothetical protein
MLRAQLQHDHSKVMIDQSLVVVEEVGLAEEEADFLLLRQFENKNL